MRASVMMNSSILIVVFFNLCWVWIFMLSSVVCREIVCIGSEREALLKLKDDLKDPSNRLSSWNATSNSNCCHWTGVFCNNVTGHVSELHLHTSIPNEDEYAYVEAYVEAYEDAYEAYTRLRFGGEISPCLVDLKHLNYLDLSGNSFQGMPIPSFLPTITSLTHLNLSGAGFMGNIPPQIGNLSNLLYLDLSYVVEGAVPSQLKNLSNLLYLDLKSDYLFIGNIDWLSSLSKLQYLDLSNIQLHETSMPIPTFLGTMNSLIHLDFSYSAFMGNIPPQIGNLSNLLYLDLSYAVDGAVPSQFRNLSNLLYLGLGSDSLFIENIDWLSSLSKLQYLDLSYIQLYGTSMYIPTFPGTMTSLIHLELSTSTFMGKIPPQIGNLSNLLYLDLSDVANGTVPSQFRNLSNLMHLGLRSDSLFIENIDWLSSLSKLQYLYLHSANLSQSFHLIHTLQALPSLQHLHLLECILPDYNQSSLLNFSSLLTFRFYHIYPPQSSSVPKWVFGMKKLVSLDLNFNNFEGSIPDGIRNLTLLENLDLFDNSFTSIPDWFYSSFRHLMFLNLRDNNLQGTIPDGLGNLTSLVRLDLSENNFKGPIPTSLSNLCNLREIYFSYLKLNQQVNEILEILSPCISHGLTTLTVESSHLSGNLTNKLGDLKNIVSLDFTNNKINGELPRSLGKVSSLISLRLSDNQFNGNPFESLRSLSKLSYLYLDDNHFQGIVTEDHLANLSKLEVFYASRNNLTLKVGPNWHPTFQIYKLDMSSWQLGPNFPSWIQSQNNLRYLEMSNTGILDYIPIWFWGTLSQVDYLNLSCNHIHGELETTLMNPISNNAVDVSKNNLHGKLPFLSNAVSSLDLSNNLFSKSMDDFLCKHQDKTMQLEFLNLASNNLSGELPDCWMMWPLLVDVNLQNNNFVGHLPASMGSLEELKSLQICDNSFSGIFPTILKKTNKLIFLDFGENNFSGTIPTWVGESLLNMKVLILRSNRLFGHIPHKICDMSFLQVLDLAQNNLSGNIPTCFNRLNVMTLANKSTYPLIYCRKVNDTGYLEFSIVNVLLWLKGRGDEYKNFLGLVTSIDLSNNKLSGEIPREITNLDALNFLNLSHNQLIGHIPLHIGNMRSIQSIDFSRNQLSGEIPPSISNLSFLSILDLSYNHLKGKIPTGTQLQTFDASNFIGNNLCGPPLSINCSSNGIEDYNHNDNGSDRHEVNWFFLITTFGFVVGFWIVIGPLFISRSWRYAYFRFLDHVWFKLQSFL